MIAIILFMYYFLNCFVKAVFVVVASIKNIFTINNVVVVTIQDDDYVKHVKKFHLKLKSKKTTDLNLIELEELLKNAENVIIMI